MKILGIISSLTDPASRARILQYVDDFKKENVSLTPRIFSPHAYANPPKWAYRLNKLSRVSEWRFLWMQKTINRLPLFVEQYKYDIIWQNRLILPRQSFFEKNISRPTAFDFDDAIWLGDGEKHVAQAIAKSQIVFAGNDYLAEYAEKHNKNVVIIPSTINTDKIFPLKKPPTHFTIGWIGSETNFKYLDIIKPAIEIFLEQHKDSRFIVVSSEEPPQFHFDNKQMIFRQWNAEEENELINEFTVGLMPLTDDSSTRGKCSYKMLQYMACGIPVIVSPVGMNNKVLSEGMVGLAAESTKGWTEAFKTLKNDSSFYNTCSENGIRLVEKEYSVKKYTPIIIRHLKKTIGSL